MSTGGVLEEAHDDIFNVIENDQVDLTNTLILQKNNRLISDNFMPLF